MTGQQVSAAKSSPEASLPGAFYRGIGPALRLLLQGRNFSQLPRLLREGPDPVYRLFIQAHNAMVITRLLRQGWQVNFVSSFPRSGNTWVRHLLADIFLQNNGIETSTELPIHPDKIIPDFYCHWIARRDVTIPTPGVFIKTHENFNQMQQRYGDVVPAVSDPARVPPFRGCKQIYLYRSPEDALVSLFHFHQRSKHLRHKTTAGIDAFCRAFLPKWEENLAGYLRAADEGFPVLFVPYELLLQYPAEILSNLLRRLGSRHDGAIVERAVCNMQFSKLQAVERNLFNEDAFFFRKGCKGAGRAELQNDTMDIIQERTSALMEQANARVLIQQSLQGSPASSKTTQIRRDAAFQNRQSKRLQPLAKFQKS